MHLKIHKNPNPNTRFQQLFIHLHFYPTNECLSCLSQAKSWCLCLEARFCEALSISKICVVTLAMPIKLITPLYSSKDELCGFVWMIVQIVEILKTIKDYMVYLVQIFPFILHWYVHWALYACYSFWKWIIEIHENMFAHILVWDSELANLW